MSALEYKFSKGVVKIWLYFNLCYLHQSDNNIAKYNEADALTGGRREETLQSEGLTSGRILRAFSHHEGTDYLWVQAY